MRERGLRGLEYLRRVYDHDHARLAMGLLRTVDPDWIRVIDGDGEGLGSWSGFRIDEAGVEAAGCGAGLVVVSLHDVMVAGIEVEDDGVAFSGCGGVGRVDEAGAADEDVVLCGCGGGDESKE
jgi:hypothetical protein